MALKKQKTPHTEGPWAVGWDGEGTESHQCPIYSIVTGEQLAAVNLDIAEGKRMARKNLKLLATSPVLLEGLKRTYVALGDSMRQLNVSRRDKNSPVAHSFRVAEQLIRALDPAFERYR